MNTLIPDRTFYRMGEILTLEVEQDPDDTLEVTESSLLIYPLGEFSNPVLSYSVGTGFYSTIGIVLTENTFSIGCYSVFLAYDTSRADEDEAWNEEDFCIVPNYTPGSAPPAPITGISGKVYTDANDNGILDSGESGVSGMSVITVNLADFADVNRTTTDENGDYSFELDAGGYLVQVEGVASPTAYAYVTVPDGTTITQHLGL